MPDQNRAVPDLFDGPGETRACCRQTDWARTPLGPVSSWPAALSTLTAVILGSALPHAILWGPAGLLLFNDAFSVLLDGSPSAALGNAAHTVWGCIGDDLASVRRRVAAGETVAHFTQPVAPEDGDSASDAVVVRASYAPVRSERGDVAGIFVTVLETAAGALARERDNQPRFDAPTAGSNWEIFPDFTSGSTRAVGVAPRRGTARGPGNDHVRSANATLAQQNAALQMRVAERTAALAGANAALQQAVAAHARAQAERNALLRRLASAQEMERRHFARELHDEVAQHLTALGLGLQALADVTAPESEPARHVGRLRMLADTLGRELHALAVQLRPRTLDDFGLEAALASFAETWARQHARQVDVHTCLATGRLGAAVESAIYRIVQEALTNVARHSSATHVGVLVERHDGYVCVTVEDNGDGFDATAGTPSEGLGLLGIQERATLLDGTVYIESARGAGTTLFVRIPLAPHDEHAPAPVPLLAAACR